MNRRLLRELRPIVPGWVVGIVSLLGALLATWELLSGLSTAVFVGCTALVAALPFGAEFQQRTLPMLLAQPICRSRVWGEKLLLVVALACVSCAVCLVLPLREMDRPAYLFVPAFLLATACSTPFWTLLARSSIGGAALSVAGEFALTLCSAVILSKARGRDLELPGDNPLVIAWFVVYSALFLVLGWRKFARLEAKDAPPFEPPALLSKAAGTKLSWLVCRPHGWLVNLVRKEIRLQAPLFLISAVLIICWLITFIIYLLGPAWAEYLIGTFNVLTVVQIVLIPILAGAVAHGEERNLGVSTWHLTLPVSASRQWFVKLIVAASLAFLLGVVLPCALAGLTLIKVQVGLIDFFRESHNDQNGLMLAAWTGVPFVLSFWAATLLGNTIRAALMTVIALPALIGCVMLAAWLSQLSEGWQAPVFAWILAQLQVPPNFLGGRYVEAFLTPAAWVIGLLLGAIALWQSRAQFRRAQTATRMIIRYSLHLAAFVFLASLWAADTASSLEKVRQAPLSTDLYSAVQALHLHPERMNLKIGESAMIPLNQLIETGFLSDASKTWLRNSKVYVLRVGDAESGSVAFDQRYGLPFGDQFEVSVQFPDRRVFNCCTISLRPGARQ